jgi:hypothetical protein
MMNTAHPSQEVVAMNPFHQALRALIVASLILLPCCSSGRKNLPASSSEGGPSGGSAALGGGPAQFYTPPGAVFEATYTANTVRLDFPTVQRTLRSVSPDARVFIFDASDPRLNELARGKVLFLEHLGVRRIVNVQKQGNEIDLLTEAAALTDFIQDGHIQFKAPIDFQRRRAQAAIPFGAPGVMGNLGRLFGSPTLLYADEGNKMSIGLQTKGQINNWEFDIAGAPKDKGFSLSLTAIKKLSGFEASVKAQGEVKNITTAFNAVIHGQKMQEFSYNTPLEGKLHVAWAALTEGQNTGIGEARLKLPPFAKDVIDVYGVPLLFSINENLIFKPGLGGKKDAVAGGFDVTYNGTGGLEIHGKQSTPEGTMDAQTNPQPTTTSALAPHGVVIAVNAPKVSISFGTESVVEAIKQAMPAKLLDKAAQVLEKGPFGLGGILKKAQEDFFKLEGGAYVQLVTEFDFTGSGPLSLVPCTMTHLNFYAQAGADAQIGLLRAESPHFDIKKTTWTRRDPDVDICGPKGNN